MKQKKTKRLIQKKSKKVVKKPLISNEQLEKIKAAFRYGCSNFEACHIAQVRMKIFVQFCDENLDIVEEFENIKRELITRSRQNIAKEISNGNVKISMWYLERRCPEEFSPIPSVSNAEGDVRIVDDI